MKHNIISVRNISYSTPAETILENVSFDLYEGEILSIIGTNGVGKSLLGKIIAGLERPNSGSIILDGDAVYPGKTDNGFYEGIGYINETPTVIPNLTVAENLFIGNEKDKGIYVRRKHMIQMASTLLQEIGLELDPKKRGNELDLNECSKLNIARQMLMKPKLLIIDDLNCKFSSNEIENLQSQFLDYTHQGGSIITISHDYSDMFSISDKVMVLKAGMITYESSKAEKGSIREALYGTEIKKIVQMKAIKEQENNEVPVLELRNWSVGGVRNLNLKLFKNEVLGIAGVYGSGKSEIIKGINGIQTVESGDMYLFGKKVIIRSPQDALKYGIATCFENRSEMIFGLKSKAAENVSASSLEKVARFGVISRKLEKVLAREQLQRLNMRCGQNKRVDIMNSASIMKLVLARCIATNPYILIIDEPNKELDLEALQEISSEIMRLKLKMSIILTFTKIDNMCNICDRVLIADSGEIVNQTDHRLPDSVS